MAPFRANYRGGVDGPFPVFVQVVIEHHFVSHILICRMVVGSFRCQQFSKQTIVNSNRIVMAMVVYQGVDVGASMFAG